MKRKGFTIIELIVIMAIIGLLAAMAILSLSAQQAKSRDTKRKADLTNINTALQNYISENYQPPTTAEYGGADNGGWDYSSQTGGSVVDNPKFMTFLSESTYMAEVPLDPINDGSGDVQYGGSGFAYAFYYYRDNPDRDLNGYTTYKINAILETADDIYSLHEPVRPR